MVTMLTHEERILRSLLADRIVATNRWYAIKYKLRKERAERQKRTKKREPHVGNKVPILLAHSAEEGRCIDRLADALKVSRRDVRAIEAATPSEAEWVQKAKKEAAARLAEDKQRGRCGCHICGVDDSARQNRGKLVGVQDA